LTTARIRFFRGLLQAWPSLRQQFPGAAASCRFLDLFFHTGDAWKEGVGVEDALQIDRYDDPEGDAGRCR
jgi:hypothetical protein